EPVLRGSSPSRRIVEGFAEKAVHESGHRNAMTLGFMEERRDDGSRDDGHVVTWSCHRGSVTRGAGPVWCAKRFGQSLSLLSDGRAVSIGGEHAVAKVVKT